MKATGRGGKRKKNEMKEVKQCNRKQKKTAQRKKARKKKEQEKKREPAVCHRQTHTQGGRER